GRFTTDGANAVASASGGWAVPLPAPATNNVAVTARMSIPADMSFEGIMARNHDDPWNYSMSHYSALINDAQDAVDLWRRKDYDWVHLTTAPVTIAANTMYKVKLVATGANPVHLELWLDDVQKIDFDDWSADAHLSGAAGLK